MKDSVSRPFFGRFLYPRFAEAAKQHGMDRHRMRLLEGLEGRVLELGCGDGGNFPLYPSTVTELVGIEPEENLRAVAERAAAEAPIATRVLPGFAERLPVGDASLDAAVASLVLCSVRDPSAALSELERVIRPGGELRFFEHVRADGRALAAIQYAVQPVWSRVSGNCHLARDTEAAIGASGFEIESCERFEFAPGLLDKLGGPHILGVARKP